MNNYFVSLSGSDDNPGSKWRPFRTIAAGIAVLQAGDVLNLRAGHYLEPVHVPLKHGTATRPIVIRSLPGEHATIDGCLPGFRVAGNDDWELASLTDPDAVPDEYVSRQSFPLPSENDRVFRGAFLNEEPYVRLITYDRLDDLRAENQIWNTFPLTGRPPGHEEFDRNGTSMGCKRPSVYMGPGICVPNDSFPSTGRIHIRMSHTENRVAGLADYDGETDPRRVPLAISRARTTTLLIQSSTNVRFEHLSIRFGGATSVRIEKSEGIVFDHVRVLTGTSGIMLRATIGTILRHCEVRGGLPDWFFRSDRKGQYWLKENGVLVENLLGKQTLNALLDGGDNRDLEIHHCELVDGHDLVLAGERISFHHNWLHNLNDDALFLDAELTADLRIFENVITRCLTGMSFAGDRVGGRRFVYRNLFDLRAPTAGIRPRLPSDAGALRFGQFFKGGGEENGPLDLFQNTCVVLREDTQASYRHYRDTRGLHPRRSFNNIFVAINPDAESDLPIAFLPPPAFPGPTDGNCYFRIGHTTASLFRLESDEDGFDFDSIPPDYLEQSRTQYPPGFETSGIEADPLFRRRLRPAPRAADDLRLRADSPARNAGIRLDRELNALDPHAPAGAGCPDIGCYAGETRLLVGVDGRREFPAGLES